MESDLQADIGAETGRTDRSDHAWKGPQAEGMAHAKPHGGTKMGELG